MVAVALLWHLALIAVEKDKLHYAVYAIWHIPVFLVAIFFAFMHVTSGAWL
jgi:hypothetical protein